MTDEKPEFKPHYNRDRRAIRRTVAVLFLVALLIYSGFIARTILSG